MIISFSWVLSRKYKSSMKKGSVIEWVLGKSKALFLQIQAKAHFIDNVLWLHCLVLTRWKDDLIDTAIPRAQIYLVGEGGSWGEERTRRLTCQTLIYTYTPGSCPSVTSFQNCFWCLLSVCVCVQDCGVVAGVLYVRGWGEFGASISWFTLGLKSFAHIPYCGQCSMQQHIVLHLPLGKPIRRVSQ